jgi:hypothetical protein
VNSVKNLTNKTNINYVAFRNKKGEQKIYDKVSRLIISRNDWRTSRNCWWWFVIVCVSIVNNDKNFIMENMIVSVI